MRNLDAHIPGVRHQSPQSLAEVDDIGDVKVEPEMLNLATHIIDTKLSDFDPSRFEDRYQNALLELIEAKAGTDKLP